MACCRNSEEGGQYGWGGSDRETVGKEVPEWRGIRETQCLIVCRPSYTRQRLWNF